MTEELDNLDSAMPDAAPVGRSQSAMPNTLPRRTTGACHHDWRSAKDPVVAELCAGLKIHGPIPWSG